MANAHQKIFDLEIEPSNRQIRVAAATKLWSGHRGALEHDGYRLSFDDTELATRFVPRSLEALLDVAIEAGDAEDVPTAIRATRAQLT